jgi:hypothetical protein
MKNEGSLPPATGPNAEPVQSEPVPLLTSSLVVEQGSSTPLIPQPAIGHYRVKTLQENRSRIRTNEWTTVGSRLRTSATVSTSTGFHKAQRSLKARNTSIAQKFHLIPSIKQFTHFCPVKPMLSPGPSFTSLLLTGCYTVNDWTE